MKSDKPDRINLRLSPELRQSLEDAAKRNGNSLNVELSERLAKSLSEYTVCFEDYWIKGMLRGHSLQAAENKRSFPEEIIHLLELKPAPTPDEYKEEYGRLMKKMEQHEQHMKEVGDLPSLVEQYVNKAMSERKNEDK
jgi:hypothetical protein